MQHQVLLVFFSLSLNTKSDSTCKTKEFDLHQRQLLTKFNKVHVLKLLFFESLNLNMPIYIYTCTVAHCPI